jgi:hypothetical protein
VNVRVVVGYISAWPIQIYLLFCFTLLLPNVTKKVHGLD